MNNNLTEEILDKQTKVCICKSISRATIKNAIKNGASTLDEIKETTGAAKGGCNGCRCIPKIEELIIDNCK